MDLSPYRRKNPFGPYDPNDPQDATADQSIYGPSLGPAGGPPPQAASLYTPAPTGPMPDFGGATPPRGDALEQANTILSTKEQPNIYAPGPPPENDPRQALTVDQIREKYGIHRPPERPFPKHGFLFSPQAYDADVRAWQTEHQAAEEQDRRDLAAAQSEEWRQMQSKYFRNQFGAYGGRPVYVQGADGQPHLMRPNPQTGQYEVAPEVAHIPQEVVGAGHDTARLTGIGIQGETARDVAEIRNERPQAERAPIPDLPVYGYDEQGRQEIKYWENPVTHRRTPAPAGATGVRTPPRPPGGPAIDRGDPRREQFIKEYLRQNPGDEEGLNTQLAIYDRGNSPAVRKGRQMAAQPPGQPHPPLGGTAPPPAPSGPETPESIRADFKAGKITREQAKQKLARFGYQ